MDNAAVTKVPFMSPRTVTTHVEHLLAKLGVRSRAQAVAVAYRDGLVKPPATAEPAGPAHVRARKRPTLIA